jgi:hypothetical protein
MCACAISARPIIRLELVDSAEARLIKLEILLKSTARK